MKKLLLSLIAVLGINVLIHAQQTVSGKVTDDTGEALPGVNVVIKGTTTGITTDLDGNYRISVDDGAVLIFSFVGFSSQEIEVGLRSNIDVSMSGITELQEVVVTGYGGIEKESREIGYAATTVDGDEFTKSRAPNLVNSLSGRVAGVQVTQSGGSVGASTRVVIRGQASINGNNQPLYVVDGIPISNSNVASVDRFTSVDYGNRIQDINPDDVESMSVLKGPAATALYGQRAANGAIIITTKKGEKNAKTSVTINSSIRFDNPFRLPDYQNSFGQGSQQKIDSASSNNWGPRFGTVDSFINANGVEEPYVAQPDNVKDFYETGRTIINSVAIAGGDEKSTYRLSVTDFSQEGFVPNTKMDRITASFNASRDFDNKIRSSFGLNYIRTRNEGRPITGFNDEGAVGSVVPFLPRNYSIDSLRNFLNDDGSPRPFLGLGQNPYFSLNENIYSGSIDRIITNAQVGYRPTDWLDISWRVGADVYLEDRQQIFAQGTVASPLGEFWKNKLFESNINSDLIVTISKNLTDDINLTSTLGHNVFERFLESDFNNGQELTDPTLFIANNATINTPSEAVLDRTRIYGLYFDVGLSYRDFLFLNVTGRNDWNSTLPEESRSFFYPGVSTSFVVTDAFPSLKNNILSFARVRGNFAQVGNGTDAFALDFVFFPETDIFQLFGVDNNYPFRGVPGFFGVGTIPPITLVPERTNSWEVGAEFQLFEGRLLVDATYYNSSTRDQIIDIDIAPSTGFLAQTLNGGEVVNRGIELLIEGQVLRGESLSWTSSINFARNRNELVSLPEPYEFTDINGTRTNPGLRAYIGQSLGTIFGSSWRKDDDGNILINPQNGLRFIEENQEIGNIVPDFTLGFSNTLSYKGITLNVLIDWRQGGDIHSQTVQSLRSGGHVAETARRDVAYIDNGVILVEEDAEGNVLTTRPNDIPITYQQFWGQQEDVDGVFDATFVKLREASLSYELPKSLLSNTPFGSVRLGVEGQNLLLLYSAIPHIDPEVSFYGPTNAQGIEAFNLPSTRSYGFNVKLTF